MDAVAELHERMTIQPDERDVATDRLVDECLGGWPECLSLGQPDEALHLGREVEEDGRVVGSHQVVDQRDRHPPGLEPDRLLAVLEDAVVLAVRAGGSGLAVADVRACEVLEFERDVLGDMAGPGAFLEAGDEAPTTTERAGVILQGRE